MGFTSLFYRINHINYSQRNPEWTLQILPLLCCPTCLLPHQYVLGHLPYKLFALASSSLCLIFLEAERGVRKLKLGCNNCTGSCQFVNIILFLLNMPALFHFIYGARIAKGFVCSQHTSHFPADTNSYNQDTGFIKFISDSELDFH